MRTTSEDGGDHVTLHVPLTFSVLLLLKEAGKRQREERRE